jgi:thiol-disulfide isomerase/thioredoxin
MKNAPELFKLTVAWMVRSQENVKASFGDDCFIYLIEKYYLNGKTDLINDSTRNSYAKKIAMLSHNVIGVKAPDFTVLNRNEESVALKSIYAAHEYTLLMFWSPTCNHCTDEVPLLDSAVASLGKDIAIVGIDAHGEGPDWKKWISSHTFKANWIHLYDPERKSSFVSDYSVYTTPVLYLLDRKGTIVAKRIMHFNLKETLTDLASAKKK